MTQHTIKREVHLVHLVPTLREFEQRCHSLPGGTAASGSCHLQARCLQCGIALTHEELAGLLAPPEMLDRESNPRLGRLLQGYCARRSCTAYFYEITLSSENPEAERLWDDASQQILGRVLLDPEPAGNPRLWLSALRGYAPRDLLVLGCIVLGLAFTLWWNFRTPTWAAPGPVYKPAASNFEPGLEP